MKFRVRLLPLLLVLATFCGEPMGRSSRTQTSTPSPSNSKPSPINEERPAGTVRGHDLKVSRCGPIDPSDEGVDDACRIVLPRSPKDLVMEDCTGLDFFATDDTTIAENAYSIHWWDNGIGDSRSLTIMIRSPSCWNHPGLRRIRDHHYR